jgi:hypothetical protein
MTGNQARSNSILQQLGVCLTVVAAMSAVVPSAHAVVKIFDGFGDADRNNDGAITSYDTDLNDNGSFNSFSGTPPTATGPDAALANRGITEVTAAQDPTDVGIVWSGIRSFDTTVNVAKSKLKIINDNVPVGVETSSDIFNHGLALGVESRGGGSSFIGRFGQSINLGSNTGDRVVVSVDWRHWREANDNVTNTPGTSNELRWGLFQDTDHEFGQTAPVGVGATLSPPGATVTWGKDDGNWFANKPGAEGDKGIHVGTTWGSAAFSTDARIRWEYNLKNINGGTNNGRLLEGNGATDTPGGGDTATIASPGTNGPGGVITDLTGPTPYAPHNLKMEIVRLSNGLVEVASFVDNVEILRDAVKTTDTGYNALQPIPFSYDYVAFRNANNDWDYVIDNFKLELFEAGDYNQNDAVDAADYVLWRKNSGITTGGTVPKGDGDVDRDVDIDDYNLWRSRFGMAQSGSGASLDGGAVPEPGSVSMLLIGVIAVSGCARRRFT